MPDSIEVAHIRLVSGARLCDEPVARIESVAGPDDPLSEGSVLQCGDCRRRLDAIKHSKPPNAADQ